MRRDVCPSDEILAAFIFGELPEHVLDAIREHQETCSRCESRARKLDDHVDPVIETIRRTISRKVAPDGTAGADEPVSLGATEGRERLRIADSGWPSRHDHGLTRSNIDSSEWSAVSPTVESPTANQPRLPDYEIGVSLLGRGSMGVVYKARHLKLNRVVALKMIAGKSSQASELFQIEAKAVARLQHPNIVQIFDIGNNDGQPFLALEFVEGGSLDQRIAGRPQPPRIAAEMVRTLALAADYAHRQGIVHCDLKPSNILITPEGIPKIADFGVAKWLESEDQWSHEGDVVGTPRYMAPEQASGLNNSVGPCTDIYSLGVILYEMLTGRPPHYSPTSIETLTLVCEQEPISPRQLQPRLPRDLETIALKCLRKEPAKRYGDAKLLAEDLERFLAGNPILARRISRGERAFIWARKHQMTLRLFTAITVFWLIILGLFYHRYSTLLRWYHKELTSVSAVEPTVQAGNHPETVRQSVDGTIHLTPAKAAIFGTTLAYESQFGNLGFWRSNNDRAIWTFQIDRPSTFNLSLVFSCSPDCSGNKYEVRVGDTIYHGTTGSTGGWSNFRSFFIGEVKLPAGVHKLVVRPESPIREALFDLREITVEPR
jgi:eukaryotic-like serine/threonine-protein kinase